MPALLVLHLATADGPSQHVLPWIRALAASSEITVAVPGDGMAGRRYETFAEVVRLPYEATALFPSRPAEFIKLGFTFRREVRLFRSEIVRRKPDLVIVMTTTLPAPLLAARLEQVPSIVYAAEILDRRFVQSAPRTVANGVVRQLVLRCAHTVIGCSRLVSEQFAGHANGPRIVTIYPGVDESFAGGDRETFRRAHDLVEAAPCLAVVGHLSAGRGQDVVVRALPSILRRFPSARCMFVGEPHPRRVDLEYVESLKILARELDVDRSIVFTGFVENIADALAAADIVVNPARLNEGFGRVALEALVAGRPVVSSRVGAVPEALRDGKDAILVDPESPSAIAQAVARLWSDQDLSRNLVASGRRRALEEFSAARGVEKFLATVAETRAGRRG